MDKQTKPSGGIFKVLAALLSILLVVSLVFNIVLTSNNASLNRSLEMLTADSESLAADLDAASQQIEQLTADAATAAESASALQAEYDAYQEEADAALTAAVEQGEADVTAAQEEAEASLTALQEEYEAYQANAQNALEALQAEYDNYKAAISALTEKVQPDAAAEPDTTSAVEEEPAAEPAAPFAADAVVATVEGQPVTGADVMNAYQLLVNYYGDPDEASLELYYAVAMDQAVTMTLIAHTAAALGLDQYTQEETDALYASADADWQDALDSYVSYNLALTETTTDEEKAAAYAEAEAYYADLGYTQESLRQTYLENETYNRVTAEICKDVAVTDDDVLAYYNSLVESDQALYGSDANAYENQLMMVQYGYADRNPMVHPEGYRYIKHILLAVDDDLLTQYNTLQASFDTQTADTAAEDLVTAEAVEAAKQAVLASVQPTIDEINQKLAEGAPFETLIAEYGIDPGMTDGSFPDGYEVYAGSSNFVPSFVTAAFSVSNVGDISEPFISDYGVHIVKYAGDVPGGPVALTDDLKAALRATLLDEQNATAMDAWHAAADIQYTGVIRTIEEIDAESAQ